MIGKLVGKISEIEKDSIIIDVVGIGYLVFITPKLLADISKPGENISLFISTQIKEDDISLYGFQSKIEKEWFIKLISIKGVGPKLAMIILGNLSPENINEALYTRDTNIFSNISGVGKKIAERIVSELKHSTPLISEKSISCINVNTNIINDALSALSNLGYNKSVSHSIISNIIRDNKNINLNELIKLSLKELA